MGTIKNAIYKIDNGADFDEIHFKTDSDHVMCGSATLTSQLEDNAINVKNFGAKGDSINDDTTAIKQAIEYAYKTSKKVYIPQGVYKITDTITTDKPIKICGSIGVETDNGTTLCKEGSFIGIQINSRNVELTDIKITSNKSIDLHDGLVIGDSSKNAQACVLNNITVINCGGNGITLKQCNNGYFGNISVINNNGNGFIMTQTDECNYSGNIINITNSYGNGKCGVVISGEGNRVYACSQSNISDNIRIDGWATNNIINGYTEYSINGYEVNVTGNGFANTINGCFRSTTNKVYHSATGMINNIEFTKDIQNNDNTMIKTSDQIFAQELKFLKSLCDSNNFTSYGSILFNNGLKFKNEIGVLKDIKLSSSDKLLFNHQDIVSGVADECYMFDSNGSFDNNIKINEDGVVHKIKATVKEPISADMIQLFIVKNGQLLDDTFTYLNSSQPKYVEFDVNVEVKKDDEITIMCKWFNNTSPLNNKIKVELYKK